MDFQDSPEHQRLREHIKSFCAVHCSEAREAAYDDSDAYPEDLHQALAAAGILGYCLPDSYGGGGGGIEELCIINEELSRHSNTATNILFINGICGTLIAAAGTELQKQQLLPGICQGNIRFAFALTEPNAGSDAAGIRLTSVFDISTRDTGEYLLNGTKIYTTGAADANFILTASRTDPQSKPSRGTSLFIVPTASDGLTITPMKKLAGNNIASCRVDYKQVGVPEQACLGPVNGAWSSLMIGGGLERLSVAACCLGTSRAILDDVIRFTNHREQFGQPIAKFQAVQHQVADMATRIEAMRWLIYAAAQKVAKGLPAIQQISMAKVFAAENAHEIATYGMRLLGGKAYFTDTAMPRRLRESLLAMYAGGTMEIQRNLIAKSLGL